MKIIYVAKPTFRFEDVTQDELLYLKTVVGQQNTSVETALKIDKGTGSRLYTVLESAVK